MEETNNSSRHLHETNSRDTYTMYPPRYIRITWEAGQGLDIDPQPRGAWAEWEVLAALEAASDAYRTEDAEAEL